MRKKKQLKQLDSEISQRWTKLAHGIQVNMMDIPRIYQYCREKTLQGYDLDTSVNDMIEKYRMN